MLEAMHTAYLLLGSNLGNKLAQLQNAREQIVAKVGAIVQSSSLYESEPWGFESEEWFVNQVLKVETTLAPEALLAINQQIEQALGRERKQTGHYESRTMDIDILFYDDVILQTDNLTIPHPHLHERRFTLLPLAEIAPSLQHPALKKNIATLLEECGDKGLVRKC